jgi:hypothetical protein
MAGSPNDYSMVFTTRGLAALEKEAIRLAVELEADGAPAQASLVRRAFIDLLAELRGIATTIAQLAHTEIQDEELATRVRPAPTGDHPSLQDFIGESHPLTGIEGAVGVNYEPALAQAGLYWWELHEEGSSVHVGREVRGFFQPGNARPSGAEFRVHPLFAPVGRGPKMTIQNPIPERAFVRHGAAVAEAEWHGMIRAAKGRFTASCAAAVAAAPPPRPRGPVGRGPGRRRP